MTLEERVKELEEDITEVDSRLLEAIADLKKEMQQGFAKLEKGQHVLAAGILLSLDTRSVGSDQKREMSQKIAEHFTSDES